MSRTTESWFIIIIHLVYRGGETRSEIKEKTGKGNITWRWMEKKKEGEGGQKMVNKINAL